VSTRGHIYDLSRAERTFDLMDALGAPALLICSNTLNPIPDDGLAAAQLVARALIG
jgi:hypothetical protein